MSAPTLTDLRNQAVELTGTEDVFVDVRINKYGVHIAVWDGQWTRGESNDGFAMSGPDAVNVVACASDPEMADAISRVSGYLRAIKAGRA
ncbi:hypothetical protein [Mycolicibacterium mucogenicum]|uniref:Uncharacterized protein n=1 Tax=Mycolicibacterium mucogenicum DSM 44124 TaxID=1226753 RepID=A0A8H2PJ48_MYCMU|nr:hypothetical protein [Mycolicibacterium mucogenicum]KAB7753692.1 hypothetical protein MMUC44124_24135 [Mycolicibacterium mucogenicum DSM 44124]QPG68918.1 hypothetical protein C1S78_026460 [Mycolicibacterium mucogenicum DSM 44124]